MIQLHIVYKRFTLDPKTQRVKSERIKKIFHANSNQKRSGLAKLKLDEIDSIFLKLFLAIPHGMWDLSAQTRDQTCATWIGSAES